MKQKHNKCDVTHFAMTSTPIHAANCHSYAIVQVVNVVEKQDGLRRTISSM